MTSRPVLAADIGGTSMRAALVDGRGSVLALKVVPTPAHDVAPAALIDLVRSVAATEGHGQATHAVVGLPGAVDCTQGRLLWAPHLPDTWVHLLSQHELSQHLGLPVYVANDADLAAVGEAVFGAGAGAADVAYLTVSTGIGAGVLLRGRLLQGRRSMAEVGHTVIDLDAWAAGLPSTLEELASGSGIAEQARRAGLGEIDARAVEGAAAEGDERARAIMDRAVLACAAGVCNLVMTFSPSVVVLGGGIGRRPDFFRLVREQVLRRPAHHPDDLCLVVSALGDEAGLAGAAAWAAAITGA